ncbi:DUF1289 domain-containing protein [Ralstonia pseudosolanacearum]|uniref:DUF1289 domain-containing protein n=1 Tax=Ralstonia pseudosolanacearum TaxID=1310165 RepID=UPI0008DA768A|nr:DUF1289 domain-containing protein [Ralstonia pseudosolanacearum]AXW15084.1 DUF1289 domain-containing protein [Ralstonia solanacearum]AXW38514.1 DUF1289 domain-containing protein [Ralstonia solanacearum]AZU56043.1 DUF1289 domain-containing protein [Ralstonia solanacearum]KAF3461709.1 hypothetical protein GO278_002195 [Ralstonia solanacearum]MCK4139436.1 DUF1289 domain-containing protein [Ralstonia pseudosolanacearum]
MTDPTAFFPPSGNDVDSDAGSAPSGTLFSRPDSPCIGICSTLFDEVCQGCGRTALEVSNWVFMSDDERNAVWTRILAEGSAQGFNPDGSRR